MSSDGSANPAPDRGRPLRRAAQVIIVSSVMFTFISYWRTAAVVLCDLASTSYYIGGIVETAIGPAAPWFILAVMCFSYAVRWVYIESCTLFIRGGVYRVVREALGRFCAKLAVSALMFDYILTGPVSGVSAGQYIVGLALYALDKYANWRPADPSSVTNYGAAIIACAATLYFFRQNLRGIHESSDKAMKIMIITTIMAVIVVGWCGVTLVVQGPARSADGTLNTVPVTPDLEPHTDYTHVPPEEVDPLGFLHATGFADRLRHLGGHDWLSLIGLFGLFIAFGHSILAMSGEETLAQVYREVESPKLPNFKKAAFIVFVYSLFLTAGISFLAVLLIPADVRLAEFSSNLIGGLTRYVLGPPMVKFGLEVFVVVVGFLILSGAVNTAMIGSNGVLNRVAEDGVLPDWFLKPHRRYGTTHRILYLIVGLQLLTIILSRGNVILLGEAYAFGVVWSFVFQAFAMVVLRFKDRRPRDFKVPLNIRVGSIEFPIGLSLIFLILLVTAVMNLLTKTVATITGATFTAIFFTVFLVSERYYERRRRGQRHEHLEQFNQQTAGELDTASLELTKPYHKLVAIRSPQNLYMLEKALAETDPETTDVVVMTAKVIPLGAGEAEHTDLDKYDQHLMTAVVERAERAGKQVRPLIVPTNNPLHAVLRTAKDLKAQELVVGASNKYTADEQLEQMAFYWINMHDGQPLPLTIRILGRDRDIHLDLAGGNRIPRISERQARTVAELRAAGVGVDRVLLAHDGTPESSDLFQAVLTMLDPQVALGLAPVTSGAALANGNIQLTLDVERAHRLGREVDVQPVRDGELAAEMLRLAREGKYDLLIVGTTLEQTSETTRTLDISYLVRHATCRVFVATPSALPLEPEA